MNLLYELSARCMVMGQKRGGSRHRVGETTGDTGAAATYRGPRTFRGGRAAAPPPCAVTRHRAALECVLVGRRQCHANKDEASGFQHGTIPPRKKTATKGASLPSARELALSRMRIALQSEATAQSA
ncbi:hypothetical protein SEVIR_1G294550v4 [Setaria viridis]